jgi:hypothetical protein
MLILRRQFSSLETLATLTHRVRWFDKLKNPAKPFCSCFGLGLGFLARRELRNQLAFDSALLYSLKLKHSWIAGHVPLRKPLLMLTPKCGDNDLVCDSVVNIPQIVFWNE